MNLVIIVGCLYLGVTAQLTKTHTYCVQLTSYADLLVRVSVIMML